MNKETQRDLPYLTSVRGICALAVLAFHCRWFAPGYLGVDVFFLLSGYVLTWGQMHQPRGTGAFWLARLRRTAPTHLVATAAIGAVVVWWLHARPPSALLVNLALLPILTGGAADAVNPPTRSLAVEWLAYLAFPLAFPLMARAPRLAVVPIAIALIARIILCGAPTGGLPAAWRGLSEFGLGMAIAALGWEPRPARRLAWLNAPLPRWLGEISYPLYLIQMLPLYASGWRAWTPWHSLVFGAAALALGAALHYAVEQPSRRWFKRARADRPSAPSTRAA